MEPNNKGAEGLSGRIKPHIFCIGHKIWQALSMEEVAATVDGLRELGLYHLPYDGEIIIRIFQSASYFQEASGIVSGIPAWDHCLITSRSERRPDFKLSEEKSGEVRLLDLPTVLDDNKAIHRWRAPVPPNFCNHYCDGLVAILASKGIEKKTKQRTASKLAIGQKAGGYVTTIKLLPLERGSTEEAAPGMPVRPHLRRGHIRNQHHGPQNSLIKKIWIEPTFVNADEQFISTRTAYRIIQ